MAVARSENIELQTLTEVKLQEVLAAAEEKDHQSQKPSVKAKWYRRSGVPVVGTQYLAVAVSLLFVVGAGSNGMHGHQHEEMEQTIRHHRVGVVGGDVVDDDTQFPWMASLQKKSHNPWHHTHKHFCGGFLIREDVVMTAAHCVSWMKRRHISHMRVVVGTHDLRDTSATMQIWKVKRIWVHESWKRIGKRYRYDIALLHLKHNVTLDNTVMLASLPTSGEMLPDSTICYITGWGATKYGGPPSDKLMQAHLPVIRNDICAKPTVWGKYIHHSQICAGGSGTESGCQRDSGSPLNCMVNNKYIAHGIDSFGPEGCNLVNMPNVFTRVSYFIGWIQKTLNNIPV